MHRLYLIRKQISYLKTHSHPKPYFCSYLVTWCLWEKGSLQCLWSMSPLDPGGKRSCLGIYSIGVICSLWTPHKKLSSVETVEALHKGFPTSCQHKKSLPPTPHHKKTKVCRWTCTVAGQPITLSSNCVFCFCTYLLESYIEIHWTWWDDWMHFSHHTSSTDTWLRESLEAKVPRRAWLVWVASELDNSGVSK